ncbi:MAG: hypothetical protein COY22_00040 [Candidatus Tagabacteria bacterium CG_4_10_14_0_2_um_filter_40_13]|nr:MAG: hypothetical protein COY22_00040 [Candidatus Tagabacteria bacterium CG_4_10_14_0_2_um_filter_40_13]
MLPKYSDLHKWSSLIFSAQGGRGKEKNVAAKNPVRPSKGMAEGGCGAPRSRASSLRGKNSASPEPKRSPAACLTSESRVPQKNVLFLFRRKNRARAKSEMRTKLFFGGQS